jgi:hypothetical protein
MLKAAGQPRRSSCHVPRRADMARPWYSEERSPSGDRRTRLITSIFVDFTQRPAGVAKTARGSRAGNYVLVSEVLVLDRPLAGLSMP